MSSRRRIKRVKRRRRAPNGIPSMVSQEDNVTLVRNGGKPPSRRRRAVKFFDSNVTAYSPSSSGIVQSLFAPAQGVSVTNRLGDVCFLRGMVINYTINAANADVVSSCRIILFQWKPNANLLAPTVSSILQLATDNIYAMYDWNFSDQYVILYDKLHSFSGTSTAPTASSNQNWAGEISLSRASKKVNFAVSAVTGSNEIYLLAISDSAVIPFPTLTFKSRVMFEDEY